jgi:hypothetical protein
MSSETVGDDPDVTARSNQPDPPTPRPLSNWTILVGALVVLGVAAVIWFVLFRRYGGQGAPVQLDAIRTAGTLVIGTGGAVALLLTARQQRYTELSLVHTDRDATERRITELYSKAADQLGSEKAPVQLAGLYALERLAHSTVEHRQTIVDVICAYLRMPYTLPDEQPPAEEAPAETHTRYENRRQEQQVRLTAQNILYRNLRVTAQRRRRWWHRTPPAVPAWPGIRLDLTGAFLHEFSLAMCQVNYVNFRRAQFTDRADFEGTQFTGAAHFADAQFTGGADFGDIQFTTVTNFGGTQFVDWVSFKGAQFMEWAYFGESRFTGAAGFADAEFTAEGFLGMSNSPAGPTSGVHGSSTGPTSRAPSSPAAPISRVPSSPMDLPGARSSSARPILRAPGWPRPPSWPRSGRWAGRPDPLSQGKTPPSYT